MTKEFEDFTLPKVELTCQDKNIGFDHRVHIGRRFIRNKEGKRVKLVVLWEELEE